MVIKKSDYKALLERTQDTWGTCILFNQGIKCEQCPFINEGKRADRNGENWWN